MVLPETKENQRITVNVVRTDPDSHQFIVTYGDDGKLYRLPMLLYQKRSTVPNTLPCIVEESFNGGIHLRQDYETLIRQFYHEGDKVEFSIKRSHDNFYILQESHGFTTRLDKSCIPNPALTPRIICQVEKIKGRYMQVQPVENLQARKYDFPIKDNQLATLLGNRKWNNDSLRELLLGSTNPDLFDNACYHWIANMATDYHDKDLLRQDLIDFKESMLHVLEQTDLLNMCDAVSRGILENRFTDFIEQTSFFINALDLVKNNLGEEYIGQVLNKLECCNYVFHPRECFFTMLCIFLQDDSVMQKCMPRMISIIRKHDLALSKRAPFGKLWITLLEYYIRKSYETPDSLNSQGTTETMIQALALQLNLAEDDDSDLFDVVLNRSLLYRLCSKMGVADPKSLLEESLYNLVSDSGDQAAYVVNTDDATLTANIIANQVSDTIDSSLAPVEYLTDNAKLLIKDGKISISASDVNSENVYTPLPTRLNLWHAFTIRLSEKPSADLRGNKSNTLPHFKQLWDFIYKSLFIGGHRNKKKERRRLLPGEEVSIIIKKKIPTDDETKLLFQCEVIDEELQGITGYIDAARDIVPYYPSKKLSLEDFYHNGYPLILPADVDGIEDGEYHFVMNEICVDFMEDYRIEHLNFNSRLRCVLNNSQPGIGRVPAISTNGLSLSVDVEPGTPLSVLSKGKVVEVYKPTQGRPPYINVTYRADVPDMVFSVGAAFHQFMVNLAHGEVFVSKEEQEPSEDFTSTMDAEHLTELMYIFETYASFEDDYIKAYNYISTCRVLARMLNSEREQYYCKRLSLLELLNDFALNNSFSKESMAILNNADSLGFEQDSHLYNDFQQMTIVSWLDNDDHYDDLYQMSCKRENPTLQMLAALVMSHNTVKKAGLISQADEIREKIRSILKLRRNQSDKKDYGREDYHTEFKTSIVYPESSMQSNLAEQTSKILQEICAFLNADGGTLYLGVNDQGTESGVEEDLKHPKFNGNLDHYEDYIHNQVAIYLGQEAAHNIKTHWDEGTKANVLAISILPSPDPIALKGDYYERMGKSARRVNSDYLSAFLIGRKKWAAEHQLMTKDESPAITSTPAPISNEINAGTTTTPAPFTNEIKDKIQTSRFRNNVIHDYELNYLPTTAYLCFIDNDEYKLLQHDDYRTEDYRLELAIHEEEEKSWLIMVYSDGRVVKASVEKLLHRDSDRTFKRYSGKELIYASIASDDDEIILGFVDGKGNKRLRFDDISKIKENSMQDYGETLCDVSFSDIHYVEVINRNNVPEWVQLNPPRKELGIVLKTVNGKRIAEMLPECSI